ncbi:class I SAM-dependent methyltransferase [Microvirga pakistanensis]|uniref:class I SAM-dependent methyltransferase n=1 Tax=Microvirga pakistanensis TaxID=1682650 RepID=UPI00106A2D78|nr:class I SAM-dependent methyltransferase [Microvirga pakistanensis]
MPMTSGCNETSGASQTSMDPVLQYHYGELDIAKDPAHPSHALPPIRPDYRHILDIGCGMGQSLMALPLTAQVEAWGIDCDATAIAAGSRFVPQNVHLLVATGEILPFPDQSFDLVFSRVALPYMDVPKVIGEVARVLRPRGEFWAMLHPPSMLWDRARQNVRSGRIKDLAVCGYIGVNSLMLHMLGRQFRIGEFCETVQTYSGMQRILAAEGLQPLTTHQSRHLIVRASKA